jgi:hypothetical protein
MGGKGMGSVVSYVRVALFAAGVASSCMPVAAAVQSGGSRNELRSLVGHVFTGETQPVPKAVVYLKNTKTLAVKTYITESDGSYRFPALAPNVDYEVYAEFQGAHSDTKTLSAFDSRKQPDITLRIHSGN